ncbi:hypothetical protein GCM10011504_06190 [Siccirubricoccus deserti]|nr:hypothetical protein GCM10011504_06190 [Siccirubricoccus deserti]
MVSGRPACTAARARGSTKFWAGAGGQGSAAAPGGRASDARHSNTVKKPRIVQKWRKREGLNKAKSCAQLLRHDGSGMRPGSASV